MNNEGGEDERAQMWEESCKADERRGKWQAQRRNLYVEHCSPPKAPGDEQNFLHVCEVWENENSQKTAFYIVDSLFFWIATVRGFELLGYPHISKVCIINISLHN